MLYLKKVEMYGFKSFADKVELKFDQPVTGIVGPNGCGKSNISDAIRWVLGEQSTKNLRGKLMQDLIFNGTDSRKSMSYCEVSLFMDNTTRIFPIDMDEIIISRKLYRNNESEYLLNRNVVRLKDILALLRGVGLGKEGYSIVGQGRMDAILNARPEDRRAIFEEALGISSFRLKKEETERKLEKTRGNIESTMIIVEELKHRLPELRRQSTIAKKYLDLYNELRLFEINAYIYGYDNASLDKENGKKKIQGLKEEFSLKESKLADANEKYDELFHKRNSLNEEIAKLHDKKVELAVELQKNAGEKNLVLERVKSLQKEIELTNEQISRNESEISSLDNAVKELKLGIDKYNSEKTLLFSEKDLDGKKFAQINARVDSIKQDTDDCRKKIDDIVANISLLNSKIASLEAEKSTLEARLIEIKNKEIELSDKLKESAGEEGDLIGKHESLLKRRAEEDKKAAELRQIVKNLEYQCFEQDKEVRRVQQIVSSEKGGIDMLRDFAENYKGYTYSVQSLMQDAQKNSELSAHICGAVGNLIKVEPRLQNAIEVALGGRLQSVVAENEDDVKYLINYLKSHDYGRATFLPVSSMKPHGIDRAEVLKESGVLGIASELVSFDRHYLNVFDSLLGGIIIVDTYDNAVKISKKYHYVHRIVTLTGERINNDGSLEGGSIKKQNNGGLLSYDSQISEREERLKTAKAELVEVEGRKIKLENSLKEARNSLQTLLDGINALNVEIVTAKEKIETSNTLSNSDKNNILSLSGEKEKIDLRLKEIDELLLKTQNRIDELSTVDKKTREKLEHLKSNLDAENTAKENMYSVLSGKGTRIEVLANNIALAEKEIKSNSDKIFLLKDDIEQRNKYILQINNSIDILYKSLDETAINSALQNELNKVIAEIESSDNLSEQINKDFQFYSDERMRLSNELEGVKASIEHEEYVISKIDDDLIELQERVQDEYGITYSAAMQYKDENYDKEAGKARISELKGSLQRLGSVNVHAIDELAETEERYNNYIAQIDDLNKAEDDLKSVLKGLESDIEVRFREGMDKINENFKVIFRELFNGGNARLYVENDPTKEKLNQGIEIEAQPPGKKLQNISLLSGGERTMTACSILFAILKYNPMPFCVLDEIEAALDDANCERIAKYLRKFSSSTQFVVITHKKPTMENADVLYGVTMEEKGVSKIVSVKLTEAVKQAM